MSCASVIVFGGTECVGSRFHVLRSQTRFRRYRGRRVPFSCFALPDSFSAVPRASGPVFMFCAPGLIFGGTERVGSRFHVLRSRTRFRRYRGRRVPFCCFALPNPFLAVPRASGPVFMFYAPGRIFGGTEGIPSRFHVLRSQTYFQRYRGRRVPISCFALPDSFSAVPRASGPVFMFYAPRLVFDGTRASGPIFMFYAPGYFFGGTEGVGFRFHVLRSRINFRRYRERRVPFSCIACPDMFSAVPRVSGPVVMFCVPGLVFGGTGSSGPVFLFCAPGLVFDGTDGVGFGFHVLRGRTHFYRYRAHREQFSCFALPYSFSAVPRASSPVFMSWAVRRTSSPFIIFCASGLIFTDTVGIESRFHVLHAPTHFRRYRGRWVPSSCIARLNSFSAVPSVSDPIFIFCAPGLIFGGTEGVQSRFHVFCS
jgi:hypothetical protein